MNKLTVFGIGAAFGAIAGYLIGDVVNFKLDEMSYDEELELDIQYMPTSDEREEMLYDQAERDPNLPRRDYTAYAKEKATLDSLVAKYQPVEEDDEEHDEPYVVSLDEWSALSDEVEKEYILFYPDAAAFVQDGTLVNLPDPHATLGPNVQLQFGNESDDPDVVYIHDPALDVYYEVVKMKTSYAVDVLGEPEEEQKPKRRKRAAKPDPAKEVAEEITDDDSESQIGS